MSKFLQTCSHIKKLGENPPNNKGVFLEHGNLEILKQNTVPLVKESVNYKPIKTEVDLSELNSRVTKIEKENKTLQDENEALGKRVGQLEAENKKIKKKDQRRKKQIQKLIRKINLSAKEVEISDSSSSDDDQTTNSEKERERKRKLSTETESQVSNKAQKTM